MPAALLVQIRSVQKLQTPQSFHGREALLGRENAAMQVFTSHPEPEQEVHDRPRVLML